MSTPASFGEVPGIPSSVIHEIETRLVLRWSALLVAGSGRLRPSRQLSASALHSRLRTTATITPTNLAYKLASFSDLPSEEQAASPTHQRASAALAAVAAAPVCSQDVTESVGKVRQRQGAR